MKKLFVFLLFILILLSASALGEEYLAPEAFILNPPQGWKSDYSRNFEYSSPEQGFYFLGHSSNQHMVLESRIFDDRDGYGAFSLYRANKRDLMTYMTNIESEYANVSLSYLKRLESNPQKVPFLLYHVQGTSSGEYYLADTMSGGWRIRILYYPYYAEDRLGEKELAEFETILSTFEPIR